MDFIIKTFATVCMTMLFTSVAFAQQSLIGSFKVGDGPFWTTNPPTYSCVEACASLFGGSEADYSCSTSDQVIDNQAYVDGWANFQYCSTPVSESYKVNNLYNCGSLGCAYSAYVDDHSACDAAVNYCYSSVVQQFTPVPVMNKTGMLILAAVILLVGFGIQRVRIRH